MQRPLALLVLVMAAAAVGCSTQLERKLVSPEKIATLDGERAFLKAHLLNGSVVVFDSWDYEMAEGERVVGTGTVYDVVRAVVTSGPVTISVDSVAIFETNTEEVSDATAALAVLTGVSAGITILCLTNTKACFGSCPTFYADSEDGSLLQAEGFSSSIAPSLEATDVDHLFRISRPSSTLRIEMRNEALETHVVRFANVLVAEQPRDGRVLQATDGTLWRVADLTPPLSCSIRGQDCTPRVRDFDGDEYHSPTDSTDLGLKEEIELLFEIDDDANGPLAIAIAARQSLVSTFLLYQALAYMGGDVTDWFSMIERGELKGTQPGRALGGIDVLVPDEERRWQLVETVHEHGPLAADVHLVPLPDIVRREGRARLRMSRGSWRIDYAALGILSGDVAFVRVHPSRVTSEGREDRDALEKLVDAEQVLVTMPGDNYVIEYPLPNIEGSFDVFLESRGYYLEWIRQEWKAEEDRSKLMALVMNPRQALRDLAPAFKAIESDAETAFWNSRYVRTP